MPSYLSFARFYDGLMQDACYEKRCDYILKLAESFGHDMGITLDLACGTGTLTRLLKKRGVDVFGIDYSMEMLSEAMQSASEEGLDILFLRQKMQSIDLYGTINTCVCIRIVPGTSRTRLLSNITIKQSQLSFFNLFTTFGNYKFQTVHLPYVPR